MVISILSFSILISPQTIFLLTFSLYVAQAYLSKSLAQIILKPAYWNPKSNPPMPENKLTVLNFNFFGVNLLTRYNDNEILYNNEKDEKSLEIINNL